MTHSYTVYHSKITGYLRNNDCIKQYFCILPRNDTSRPLKVPQEYLVHFEELLFPCNIPTQIVKPLAIIKHLLPSALNNKDKTRHIRNHSRQTLRLSLSLY